MSSTPAVVQTISKLNPHQPRVSRESSSQMEYSGKPRVSRDSSDWSCHCIRFWYSFQAQKKHCKLLHFIYLTLQIYMMYLFISTTNLFIES
jgi:hypothetical protein